LTFAGTFVLVTVLLAVSHSLHWLWLTDFVGANMTQASFSGFCPLAKILKGFGLKPGEAFE
jgi:hypothetical protein